MTALMLCPVLLFGAPHYHLVEEYDKAIKEADDVKIQIYYLIGLYAVLQDINEHEISELVNKCFDNKEELNLFINALRQSPFRDIISHLLDRIEVSFKK